MKKNTDDGAKIYTPLTLKLYDWWVLGVSNRLAWGCPTKEHLLPHFLEHLGNNHLDIGVGTGFYLAGQLGISRLTDAVEFHRQLPVLADVISQRRTAVINLHTGTAVPAVAGIVRVADALRADHPELCPEKPRRTGIPGGLNEQFTVKGVHPHTRIS